METLIASKSRQVVIGPDRPFVVIGERINPTRRKRLMETMAAGDFTIALEDARNQVAAGAQILDVNAGVPNADEPELLARVVAAVMDTVDVPLCFDSANPAALQAALAIYPGKALVNSTTGETSMMESVLPLVAKYHAAVIGILSDENGIPGTMQARLAVAQKIVHFAAHYSIPPEDVILDCLAIPVGTQPAAGITAFETMRLVRNELGVNLSLGASNVSFGLPDRKTINVAYLALSVASGLTAAITDPTVPEIRNILLACDLLMARDKYAARWIKNSRTKVPVTS